VELMGDAVRLRVSWRDINNVSWMKDLKSKIMSRLFPISLEDS